MRTCYRSLTCLTDAFVRGWRHFTGSTVPRALRLAFAPRARPILAARAALRRRCLATDSPSPSCWVSSVSREPRACLVLESAGINAATIHTPAGTDGVDRLIPELYLEHIVEDRTILTEFPYYCSHSHLMPIYSQEATTRTLCWRVSALHAGAPREIYLEHRSRKACSQPAQHEFSHVQREKPRALSFVFADRSIHSLCSGGVALVVTDCF